MRTLTAALILLAVPAFAMPSERAALTYAAEALGLPDGGPMNYAPPKVVYDAPLQGRVGRYERGVVKISRRASPSTLVHEMVHHVLAVNSRPQCEAVAYAVQLRYIDEVGPPHPMRQYIAAEARKRC